MCCENPRPGSVRGEDWIEESGADMMNIILRRKPLECPHPNPLPGGEGERQGKSGLEFGIPSPSAGSFGVLQFDCSLQ